MPLLHGWHRGRWWPGPLLWLGLAVGTLHSTAWAVDSASLFPSPGGIQFECPGHDVAMLRQQVQVVLVGLGVPETAYETRVSPALGALQFQLPGPITDTGTLDLMEHRDLDLREELVTLPANSTKTRTVLTVSRKEIALALMQRGRVTHFTGRACHPQALADHIGIRQNTVAWIESVRWIWPDGGPARWNSRYWRRGNLRKGVALHTAVADFFLQPRRYAVGCYTATKLAMLHGVLDYYQRVRKDPAMRRLVETMVGSDGAHLTHLEPGAMWYFESDVTDEDMHRRGKLMRLEPVAAPDNFVPGDWAYLLNTDPVTYEKTGYEGSNAVYLGRGKFDDYYDDHNHSYSYAEKLLEVYQWRNGVFSHSRDIQRIQPRSAREVDALAQSPENGGLLLTYRAVPYLFGYESPAGD